MRLACELRLDDEWRKVWMCAKHYDRLERFEAEMKERFA